RSEKIPIVGLIVEPPLCKRLHSASASTGMSGKRHATRGSRPLECKHATIRGVRPEPRNSYRARMLDFTKRPGRRLTVGADDDYRAGGAPGAPRRMRGLDPWASSASATWDGPCP